MDSHASAHERFASQPEILPPDAYPGHPSPPDQPRGWYPPPQTAPRPPRRRHWASAPATYTLIGVNVAVFLFTLFQSRSLTGPTFQDPPSFSLLCNGGYILFAGQWWRVLTSLFVHFGWIHIAGNMWCLWNLGLLGEPLLGEFGIVAAYILTGIAGNLLSIAFHPIPYGQPGGILSAGASGAVFGIAGVLLMLLRSPLLPIPAIELKKLRRSVWYFAIINLFIGLGANFALTSVQIDNTAHLGGFLSGIAFGLPLVPRIGALRSTFVRRRAITIGAMAFVLLLIAWGLRAAYASPGS
ncbi:MAG TPA: rhomboid family intramembrane serine protease [Acidobacteriaceae bacterium]|jgi:rhomboid protease GluP|nr:rhomboid family intramembrane serine protease [Acidobacteriaceae bacterium]